MTCIQLGWGMQFGRIKAKTRTAPTDDKIHRIENGIVIGLVRVVRMFSAEFIEQLMHLDLAHPFVAEGNRKRVNGATWFRILKRILKSCAG
ncbi:hypothetical protein SAMN02745166_03600 [Prosthecobacter debontii]|uniref:Uncharacterized protein n=1 Tax=Prosthecobacter debontii TaxID=48467 RepID=A0A1T4YL33_9BACT|nr:hypothetical protein SAMN02745166_03600 [Prosthecobacter debontii]